MSLLVLDARHRLVWPPAPAAGAPASVTAPAGLGSIIATPEAILVVRRRVRPNPYTIEVEVARRRG